ncbi:TctB family tripartite tricarboxylate transporter protein (plasmid) [Rhizobium gallicum]|uniref:TctB family tripartite tricarboxylate transporter protein n=2 Tax=Rhizobium gallicum TaxID=56730 RepID=A0A1L5NS57_9HYPH|nr:TctB family tripartite tricarboxylate transporter protein [Rhizobium gallicum]
MVTSFDRHKALAGAVFGVIGTFGLWYGQSYRLGTASQMDSGYLPRIVFVCLLCIGVALLVTGLRSHPEADDEVDEVDGAWSLRPIACVTLAIVAFGFGIERVGLIASTIALVTLAILATGRFRYLEWVLTCLSLVVFSAAVFVWALRLPLPLLPEF